MLTKEDNIGLVKTRLAAEIGFDAATVIHSALTIYNAEVAIQSGLPFWVSFDGNLKSDLALTLTKMGAKVFKQPSGSLGEKIFHAFSFADRSIVIGSDCPWITTALLDRATKTDALVLGPAEDGGYYLIAANKPPFSIFESIDWSTHKVFEQTLSAAQKSNATVQLLPLHYDIDTGDDLFRALQSPHLPPILSQRLSSHVRSH